MELYFSIALGGALGALTRYQISVFFTSHYLSVIPWGTIFANILGSFPIGVLFVVFQEKLQQFETMRGLLTVGFLGAMTTFSSFSLRPSLCFKRAITNPPLDILLAVLDFVYLPLLLLNTSHTILDRIILIR